MSQKVLITAQELFEYLCQNQNDVSCVQAPGGRDLLAFLSERLKIRSKIVTDQILNELVLFRMILKEYYKNKLFRIKLLATDWGQAEIPESMLKSAPESETKIQKVRKFAVFIDYKNISDGMGKNGRGLKSFRSLLQPILDQGEIIFGFAFVPSHFVTRLPVMELTYKYGIRVIICPRQIEGVITKDKDSVDAQMDSLARDFIEHASGITDVVIFSGDADFQDLVRFAVWRQKTVTVMGARESISGRFLEMAEEKIIGVAYC